jgi:hypothetical protein
MFFLKILSVWINSNSKLSDWKAITYRLYGYFVNIILEWKHYELNEVVNWEILTKALSFLLFLIKIFVFFCV